MPGPELQAKIGADASDLIGETKKASSAWSKFTKGLTTDSKRAKKNLGEFGTAAKSMGRDIKAAAKNLRAFRGRAALGNIKALAASTLAAGKAFGRLGLTVGKVGFRTLRAGAAGALTVIKSMTKGVIALGVALTAIAVKAAISFGKFQNAFAQVTTLLDATPAQIAQLDADVRRLSVTYGEDLAVSVKAAYDTISAGVSDPVEATRFLNTAFKAGAAGAASVAEATDLITSALNAYALPASEATRVSDIFFKTVKVGKTTVGELASSIGAIVPIASAAGISLEEMGAALAALTASGLKTEEAATALKGLLAGIAGASGESKKALAAAGIEALSFTKIGLEEVMRRIRDETGGALPEIKRLLPNIRAANAAAVLSGKAFGKFQKALRETADSAGASQVAFEKVAGTVKFAFAGLRQAIENAFVQIGRLIGPSLKNAFDRVKEFVTGITEEIDILGKTLKTEFRPIFEEFFGGIGTGSEKASTALIDAVGKIGEVLQGLGRHIKDAAGSVAGLIATFQALGKIGLIIARLVQSVIGLAFSAASVTVEKLIGAIAALADAVGADELAGSMKEAQAAVAGFGDEMGKRGLEAAQKLGDEVRSFEDVDKTFDTVKAKVAGFGKNLDRAGAAAERAADKARKLREETDEAGKSAVKAGKAETKQAEATNKAATSQQKKRAAAASLTQANKELASGTSRVAGAQAQLAGATGRTITTMREYFDIVAKGAEGTKILGASTLALQAPLAMLDAATIQVKEDFNRLNLTAFEFRRGSRAALAEAVLLGKAFDTMGIFSDIARTKFEQLSGGLQTAFRDIANLTGRFRLEAEQLVIGLGKGTTDTRAFKEEVSKLAALQVDFLDPSVFETFAQASGFAQIKISSFAGVMDELRVVSNVLTGDFRKAADTLIKSLGEGRINTRQFREEILKLAGVQLGLTEVFRSVEDLAKGFKRLAVAAREARGAIGAELRGAAIDLKKQFDAGKISLDEFLDSILKTGERVREFAGLTNTQVVAFQKLRGENEELAKRVLELAKSLGSDLKPGFDDLLEAFRQGLINSDQLGKGLERLTKKNAKLAKSAKDAAKAMGDQGKAAKALGDSTLATTKSLVSFLAQAAKGTPLASTLEGLRARFAEGGLSADDFRSRLTDLFGALASGRERFVEAAEAAKLFESGNSRLIRKIDELAARTSDLGRNQLQVLLESFREGIIDVAKLREELQKLADSTVNVGRAAEEASRRIAAFSSPGGIQVQRRGGGGAELLGLQGRATGSSNFGSEFEARLGAAVGMGPKALRSAINRAGGIDAFLRRRGLSGQRFTEGGSVLQTGPARVEAGEFVLSQRGLSDLGRIFASALGRGGGSDVTMANTFNLSTTQPEGGLDVRALAFQLAPELRRMGILAAARSPIS